MKNTVLLLLLFLPFYAYPQFSKNIFGKNPIINMENEQNYLLSFGYYFGLNNYDFKINYKSVGEDIQTIESTSFQIGLVTDLRVTEYFHLRFEPGYVSNQRKLEYPNSYFKTPPTSSQKIREVNSNYVYLPVLVKIFSLRTGNIRPYLLAGFSTTYNLTSNANSTDDNLQQTFRAIKWNSSYELGIGIDLFLDYFIFSPSIKGVFGLKNEMIKDNDPNSPWTGNVESMKSRGVFVNFTFQ